MEGAWTIGLGWSFKKQLSSSQLWIFGISFVFSPGNCASPGEKNLVVFSNQVFLKEKNPHTTLNSHPKKSHQKNKAHRLLNSSVWRVGSSIGCAKRDVGRGVLVWGFGGFEATQVSGSRGIGWLGDS